MKHQLITWTAATLCLTACTNEDSISHDFLADTPIKLNVSVNEQQHVRDILTLTSLRGLYLGSYMTTIIQQTNTIIRFGLKGKIKIGKPMTSHRTGTMEQRRMLPCFGLT